MCLLNEDADYRRHGKTWAAKVAFPLHADIGLLHGWEGCPLPATAFDEAEITRRGIHLSWREKINEPCVASELVLAAEGIPERPQCRHCDTLFCLPPRTPPNSPMPEEKNPDGMTVITDSLTNLEVLHQEACKALSRLNTRDSAGCYEVHTLASIIRYRLEHQSNNRDRKTRLKIDNIVSHMTTAANIRLKDLAARSAGVKATLAGLDAAHAAHSLSTACLVYPIFPVPDDANATPPPPPPPPPSLRRIVSTIDEILWDGIGTDAMDNSLFKTKPADFDTYLMCETGVSQELERIDGIQYQFPGDKQVGRPTEEQYIATISMIRRTGFRFEKGDGTHKLEVIHPVYGSSLDISSFMYHAWSWKYFRDRHRADAIEDSLLSRPYTFGCPGPGCLPEDMARLFPESHTCRFRDYYNPDYDQITIYKDILRKRLVAAYQRVGCTIDPDRVSRSHFWAARDRQPPAEPRPPAEPEVYSMIAQRTRSQVVYRLARAGLARRPGLRAPATAEEAFATPPPRGAFTTPEEEEDSYSDTAVSISTGEIFGSRARYPFTPQATPPRATTPATTSPTIPPVRNAASQPVVVGTAPAVGIPIWPIVTASSSSTTLPEDEDDDDGDGDDDDDDDDDDPGFILATVPSTIPGQPPIPALFVPDHVHMPVPVPRPPGADTEAGADVDLLVGYTAGPITQATTTTAVTIEVPQSLQQQLDLRVNDFVIGAGGAGFVKTKTGFLTVPPVSCRNGFASASNSNSSSSSSNSAGPPPPPPPPPRLSREVKKALQKAEKKERKRLKQVERERDRMKAVQIATAALAIAEAADPPGSPLLQQAVAVTMQ